MDYCPFPLKLNKHFKKERGVSITEVLLVVIFLGVLALAVIAALNPRFQINKANDARRKSDLNRLKIALEDYFDDHRYYPKTLECGESFSPYLDKIPCDPEDGSAYVYALDGNSYNIYTKLDNEKDSDIALVGCQGAGCGPGGTCVYNYGVSSPNTKLDNCNGVGGQAPRWGCKPGCVQLGYTACGSSYVYDCAVNYNRDDCYGACQGSTETCVTQTCP